MLIPFQFLIDKIGIKVRGILHIGAHECEEIGDYIRYGVPMDNIYWVEAMANKVDLMKRRIPSLKIFQAVICDVDNESISFDIFLNSNKCASLTNRFECMKTDPPCSGFQSTFGWRVDAF